MRIRLDTPRSASRRALLLAVAAWPALAWAGAVFAQSKPPILIGWLSSGSGPAGASLAAFKEGMAALGWKEGANYALEARWAGLGAERYASLAQELAAKRPALIVTSPSGATMAAAKAAPNTPVVQANGGSPVDVGLAKSLARPGGMVTGVTNIVNEISEKYLEVLLDAAPRLKRIGFLVDSTRRLHGTYVKTALRSAEYHRVEAHFGDASKPEEIEAAISRLAKAGVQGLVVMPPAWFGTERARIVKLALAQRWPVVAGLSSFVEAGALLSYGADRRALFRRAAYYVDRILKGANPGDLPIEQPTRFELVVNLRTAKALGLTVPQPFLLRADRVIE